MEYNKKQSRNSILNLNKIIKKHSTVFLYLFAILLFSQFISCNSSTPHKFITEGIIVYQIQYIDNGKNNSIISFLPSEMTTSFKMNASRTSIEGPFGTFKLSYILNYPAKQNFTLLQIMDKKYVYKSELDGLAFGYSNYNKVKIIYSDLEKDIAGYKCKHASVIFEDISTDTVNVFYTNEIGLMHPNYNNPFKEIEGVLMEFSINLVNIKMNLKAKSVRGKEIDDEYFKVPDGFISISEMKMKKLIDDFNRTSEQ